MTSTQRIQGRLDAGEASARVLSAFAGIAPAFERIEEYGVDFGPAVVAALASGGIEPPADAPETRALAAWLGHVRFGCGHPGLFGRGLAGAVLGLRTATSTWPALASIAEMARRKLASHSGVWWRDNLGWFDYDLVTGPAGTLLVLASDPACTPSDLTPTLTYLLSLCGNDDLAGLRVKRYQNEDLRGWNHGRINTGMAHGVAGVTAALCAAATVTGLSDEHAAALRRLASWLVAQSFTDATGLLTWPQAGDGVRVGGRPQAWCYGTPGVAWTLWETGRILHDAELRVFALRAAASFLAIYNETAQQPDLTICHGIPGLVLLCDAFDRYTDLPGAATLRDHFVDQLTSRLDEVVDSAPRNATLLSGATGACAALLTLLTGNRTWLPAIGLR